MTPLENLLYLGIRLAAAERRLDIDQRELRNREPDCLRERTDEQLRNERLGALSRTAELDDEEPSAISVNNGWQRPSFVERLQVAGGGECGEFGGHFGCSARLRPLAR